MNQATDIIYSKCEGHNERFQRKEIKQNIPENIGK